MKESFFLPDRECFSDFKDFLRIGLPAAAMVSLEYWIIEVEVLLSSFIDVISNAAMVIILNTFAIVFIVPYCLHIASNVFVGKAMGEGNYKKA